VSLSLPALAPSPSGVSQSLPVAAGASLLPPSYPLRGGRSSFPGRGRQRKRGADLIKFPETSTTRKKTHGGGIPPFFPAPLQSQTDRCRWSGAEGSRAAAAAVALARGAWVPACSGSGSFGGGGGVCSQAVPPVNCLHPRAARPPASPAPQRGGTP
jgi:hypothetical protein